MSAVFTESGISFACASSSLTCHGCVPLSLVLQEGIPERRIPLAAFQKVSDAGSSVTPLPRNDCGGFENIVVA